MATDLINCKIHVEQQLPSHIYIDRFYQLSIYLKHNAVPKFLNEEDNVRVITSIISADTKQSLRSPHFIFENPSLFKRSGDTSTKFKITALSTQFETYRIKCEIPNSPVTSWISGPFTLVRYKFGMTKDLQLIDGDKWYKDEGGKTNFLHFEMGLHENHNDIDRFVHLNRDITFNLQLVYFDDKSVVLNQNILRIDSEQQYTLSPTLSKVQVRFKIEQVSSHHQRRRFSLKVIPMNDKTIGPCFTTPILVLSKRNRPKKTLHCMSPQKRKEVATKKKIKRKRSSTGVIIKDEVQLHKKRKLSETESANESEYTDNDDDVVLESIQRDRDCNNDNENKDNDNDNDIEKVHKWISAQCVVSNGQYPALREYEVNPDTYFDYSYGEKHHEKRMKHNLIRCLRLCSDTFCVLSGRPQYHPFYGFGEENTGEMVYYCAFCKRFARHKPSMINHYERCRILEVIELLKGERSVMSENKIKIKEDSISSNPIPLDKGVEYTSNTLRCDVDTKEEKTNININSNLDANAMISAMLQNIPNSFRMNHNGNSNNDVGPNNFAAALNEILQNATNGNDRNRNESNNSNNRRNVNNTNSMFNNMFQMHRKQ